MSLDLQKVSIRTEVTTNLPLACELQTGLPAGLLSYKQNSKKGSKETMLKDRTEWD